MVITTFITAVKKLLSGDTSKYMVGQNFVSHFGQ